MRNAIVLSSVFGGTMYFSRLLSALGMPAHHEYGAFTNHQFLFPLPLPPGSKHDVDYECVFNCSWPLSMKIGLVPKHIPVLHLVSDPLKNVNNILLNNVASTKKNKTFKILQSFTARHELATSFKEGVVDADSVCKIWTALHYHIEDKTEGRRYARFRFEDISPALINDIRVFLGLDPIDPDKIQRVIAGLQVPRFNIPAKSPVSSNLLSWLTVTDKLRNMAERYGYEFSESDAYSLRLVDQPLLAIRDPLVVSS